MNQMTLSPFANFSSSVPWGLWVAVYVWLIGISCGAYFLAMWGNARGIANLKKITGLAISLSLAALCSGLISILADLGHIERFLKLFFEPSFSSVMVWMVWLYNLYFVILFISLFWIKKNIPAAFSYAASIFALGVLVAESLLFALPPGKIWHSWVFSVHFIISSLAAGTGVLIILSVILTKPAGKDYAGAVKTLSGVLIPLIILNLALAFVETGNLKANAVPIIMGIIAIGGLLLPSDITKAISGLLVSLAILWEKFEVLVLAQSIQPFKGFREALIEPRLVQAYTPSIGEWIVALFLIGAAVVIFFIVYLFILPRLAVKGGHTENG